MNRKNKTFPPPTASSDSQSDLPAIRSCADAWGWRFSLVVSLLAFVILSFSSWHLPPNWDEGYTAQRAAIASIWKHRLMAQLPFVHSFLPDDPTLAAFRESDTLAGLLSREELDRYWPGVRTVEGHPLFPMILMSLGVRYDSFPPELSDLRFYPILFFSLSLGVVFYRLNHDFGRAAAFFGILSILLLPRVFAHAQFATWDSTLMASWMLAWALFPLALKSHGGALLYGAALGMTIASKFSGLGVLIPPFVWLAVRCLADLRLPKEKRLNPTWNLLAQRAGLTFFAAMLTFVVLNPPLWNDPLGGIGEFISRNLDRKIEISTIFFGKKYYMRIPLPWYNTLAWTAITVPLGILLLFFAGLGSIVKDEKKRWSGFFLVLNFLPLMIIRAFPGSPVHDGVRLFVPAFPFLAMIAGIGAAMLWNLSEKARLLSRTAVCLIFLASIFNMFWYAPQWLSFYNLAIGGLPGAVRGGMEPTYYWDACDSEVLTWLSDRTKSGDTVLFSDHSAMTIAFFYQKVLPQRKLLLERFATDEERKSARFYVQLQRPGLDSVFDQTIKSGGKPVFVKTLRRSGWEPWDLGRVPLVIIYDLSHE